MVVERTKVYNERAVHMFMHEIRQSIKTDKGCLILLDIPENDKTLNNLCLMDEDLKVIWRSEDITSRYPDITHLPYEEISFDGKVVKATDFLGRCFIIDIETGKILNKIIVK